ncbi:MAG: VWA domain-containing protein [Chitinophagales bacterium]
MKRILLGIFILFTVGSYGQTKTPGNVKRILILLDGSGSMVDPWNKTNKWEVAKRLVIKTIDSIQKAEPDVEIGLRVFGHQNPRVAHDCKDSKLEVAIGKNSAPLIKAALNRITPQGYTPIAYSLFLAAGDFISTEGTNSIILITDGIENCEGDPCASSESLRDKRITLKPFIIGVGLTESAKKSFDCVGSYYDAGDEKTFSNAMSIVISQALNITTTQVNLIDAFGIPVEKNIEITFYDSFSGEVKYNYVQTPDDKNQPDTLFLNPVGKYNIVAHTTPIVELKNVELTPGKHNIIGIDVPLGTLQLIEGGGTVFSEKQCVVRNNETGEIIYVQNFNTKHKYISGTYDIDILTLPRLHYENFEIKGGVDNKIEISLPGTLNISAIENKIFSIYMENNGKLEKIYESTLTGSPEFIPLLPGVYKIYSRSNIKKASVNTKEVNVTIKTGKTALIKV